MGDEDKNRLNSSSRRNFLKIGAGVVAGAAVVSVAGVPLARGQQNPSEEGSALQARLTEANTRAATLASQLDAAQARLNTVGSQVSTLQGTVNTLQATSSDLTQVT